MTTLSKSPARIAAQFLVQNSAGGFRTNVERTEPGWLVCCGIIPATPDSIICISPSPAERSQGRLMNGEYISNPPLQVRVRAAGHDTCYEKASAIFNLIESCRNATVTVDSVGFLIQAFILNSLPIFMGNDEGTDRPNYVFDCFLIAKEL
jgi:hypothetical protein